ncbi:hypothetical protein [Marinilabilia rubra]|uniref:DUF5689 domain-containing protein n=1 Tax=Marinilabilia rubra TaxID=2162893 RepID=A0A2U2BAV7_9BACT|nr:hypothetical protein [Marinilabilia rubra]PWE00205.1 hypothetical protein DDZ16_07595 [Marinilabilia rubra]
MMKRFFNVAIGAPLVVLMACSSGEAVQEASQLKPGQKFNSLTISEVRNSQDGFALLFRDTIVLEGVVHNSSLGDYGVSADLLDQKIKVADNIIDPGVEKVLYFRNPKEIGRYFSEAMFIDTPDGKVLSGNHHIKVRATGLEVNTNSRDLISAKVVDVLSIDGKQPVEPTETMPERLTLEKLRAQKGKKERQLWEIIGKLVKAQPPENGLFYKNDIRNFIYYKTNDDFRAFVDELFAMGYGIEQAEGEYYLYVEKPAGYQDGEVDQSTGTGLLRMEELKKGQAVEGLTISEYELVPGDHFVIGFEGQFQTSGNLYLDEMWDEITFEANEGEKLNRELEVAGYPLKMMNYVKFQNEDAIKKALDQEKLKRIMSGDKVPVTIIVRNYGLGGAFQSEYGTNFEFVSFTE